MTRAILPVDAFSQEVHNRLRQLPHDKVSQNPRDVLTLIACDVAEDFLRDCPEALQEFIDLAEARSRD